MKSNKGITIISLIVYIIALSFVIGITSMLIKYFYNNEQETVISKKTSDQYSRFVAYLTQDMNSEKIATKEVRGNTQIILNLKDGTIHRYVYDSYTKSIYYIVAEDGVEKKYITLCENLEGCTFTESGNVVTTDIKINNEIRYKNNFRMKLNP